MMHDGKYIILPGNEQELFNRYLDNNEYGPSERTAGNWSGKTLSNKTFPG